MLNFALKYAIEKITEKKSVIADRRKKDFLQEKRLKKLAEKIVTDASISSIFKNREEYVEKAKPPTQIQSIKASGLL